MPKETRIAIVGYGNIGRGVYNAILNSKDTSLAGIITRDTGRVHRHFNDLGVDAPPVYDLESIRWLTDMESDSFILCGGSRADLPVQGPWFAKVLKRKGIVYSFDTHANIPPHFDDVLQKEVEGYFAEVNIPAIASGNTAAIAIGWDPGIFTVEKLVGEAFLLGVRAYAFYGLTEKGGLSMGHSNAAKEIAERILGLGMVKGARAYTHAKKDAIERVRQGSNPDLTPGEMHWREVFIALGSGLPSSTKVDKISEAIRADKQYFADYDTEVKFITPSDLEIHHRAMPHDGLVMVVGETSPGNKAIIEKRLQLDSNPQFTANVMLRHAVAVHRLNQEGKYGAFRPADIIPAYLSPLSSDEQTKKV